MKKYQTIFFALLSMLGTAHARLGETPRQISERYGQPILNGISIDTRHVQEKGQVYARNGIRIFVVFLDGKSVLERYTRPTGDFTPEEVMQLLQINAPGRTWAINKERSDATTKSFEVDADDMDEPTAEWVEKDKPPFLQVATLRYSVARDVVADRARTGDGQNALDGF